MDSILTGFVRVLRAAGVAVSTAETIDAARTLALVGYRDRAVLKAALGVALAKSEEDKRIHDQVFEQYFARAVSAVKAGSGQSAQPVRTGHAEVDALLALAQPGEHGQPSDALSAALAKAAAAARVDDIRFATQVGHLAQQTLQALGVAPLDALLSERLSAPGSDEAGLAQLHALQAARDALRSHARALVQQRFELLGKPATEAFMTEVAVTRTLGRMAPAEMERVKAAVTRMAKKLATRHARRQRVQLRGQLDVRRTMRLNAGYDGVPLHLASKHRRRDKPRIVAVCDVSSSVATQVRFLLLFLYALHDCVGDLRSFAFSNRLQDVAAVLQSMPFDDAMALILKEVGSGSTDYGQAWLDLQDRHWDSIDRRTTVLVLGDGRSNGADPRLDVFAQLADRAKRVVWLSPEAPGRWGTGDSALLRYRPYCTSVSYCASAMDLERVLDEVLQAY